MASVSIPEDKLSSDFGDESETKTINDLPSELLVRIFTDFMRTEGPLKFLRSVPAVCTRWRNLSTMPSLWEKVSYWSLCWNFDHLLELGKRGFLSSTKYLDLNTVFEGNSDLEFCRSNLKPADIVAVARYCPNLISIDISSSEMSRTAMEYLTVTCPHVEELVMGYVTGSNLDFDRKSQRGYLMAMSSRILDPVFSGWGKKLRLLDLESCTLSEDNGLISKLSACPSLEELHLMDTRYVGKNTYFSCPIAKLQSGCPKLRVLELCNCDIVIPSDEKLVGFREMREFSVVMCLMHGLDLGQLLEKSTELELLDVCLCDYGEMVNVPEIPSEYLKVFRIGHQKGPTEYLVKVMRKWKHTLKDIQISTPYGQDLTTVLEAFLDNNPDPILKTLCLGNFVIPMPLLKRVIRVCRNLSFLSLRGKTSDSPSMKFKNRQEIEEILGLDNSYFTWKRKQ